MILIIAWWVQVDFETFEKNFTDYAKTKFQLSKTIDFEDIGV